MKGARRPVLAVDLGGTKILACVVDARGRVLSRYKVKTAGPGGALGVVRRVVEAGQGAVREAGLALGGLAGIGVAVPGGVDAEGGVVVRAVNLGWRNLPVRRLLSRAFGRPVFVENDANAGLFGEAAFGALKGRGGGTLTGFFVGTGVGGGVMIGRRLLRGASGSAGELGHMVVMHGGPRCSCGRRGCLEALAGRRSIERRLDKEGVRPPGGGRFTGKKLRKALRSGRRGVRRELEDAAEALGVGIANLLAILNPDGLVLGGGVMEAVGDFIFPRALRAARRASFGNAFRDCLIVRSKLGDDAVVLGAAALARAHKL